ncbi:hypothetical protein [Nocardia sp. NBC_01009]|uniref:hypothetical protein n=1 Tax=Nocardia sp. NBC_01009 TaxID=2975996 RepID=UPI00386B2F62|nr:hypothetical protein OHA42_05095 [Nocardia sp. NBC_01009]
MTTPAEAETETFDLAYAAQKSGAPSADWIRRKLNANAFRGRRAGREWRMTESDIAGLVAWMARGPEVAAETNAATETSTQLDHSGLTPTSRRRLEQRRTH